MQVKIARPCHCVIKNDIETVHECKDAGDARAYANQILVRLKKSNCKAHYFFIRESSDVIIIDSAFNTDDIKI